MEFEVYQVDTTLSHDLPFEECLLMPVGDIQLGAPGCDEDRLQRHVEWGLQHNAAPKFYKEHIGFLMADKPNWFAAAAFYDSTQDVLEEAAHSLEEKFLRLVNGSQGRWLGLLQGHHFYEFRDGTTTDTRLASALKTSFLGTCAVVRLHFLRQESRLTTDIWCHHGTGNVTTPAGALNKLYKQMGHWPEVDIFLMGHCTQKFGLPFDALYVSRKKPYQLLSKTRIIGVTGGFMRGYEMKSKVGNRAQGSYVEKGMMLPTALGGLVIKIRPVHSERDRIDLNVEA